MSGTRFASIFVLCLTIGWTVGQKNDQTTNGCSVNNGTAVVAANTTVSDGTWWYVCTGTNWLAKGCVVNGRRYNVNETFFGYLNEFYGRCEVLDGKYIRTTVLGCIDLFNETVEPGNTYVIDPLFWANCTSTEQIVSTPELGNITLSVISRQIVGCNDGSEDIIPDEGNFVQVNREGPLEAGIGLICKLKGPFPQVQPAACVVANNSETDSLYVGLGDHCYAYLHQYVYYCLITAEEDSDNGTATYGWEIGWNVTSSEYVKSLENTGFSDCLNPEEDETQNNNATKSSASSRRKRATFIENLANSPLVKEAVLRRKRSPFVAPREKIAQSLLLKVH